MPGKYYVSKAHGIVLDDHPTKAMAQWMDRISAIAEGISTFIGENGDGDLTADDVTQGVNQRVIELANQAIARNTDGSIASIVYTHPDTAAVLLTEQFTYNTSGNVSQIVGTDGGGQVTTEQYTFIGDFLSAITVGVA